ncbi:MAG: DUF493 domain-containing protein [Desulfuromonadales bacterium]|nr:DUF493 domain-containing protein [Desulfuromonadales bacterium]
MTWQHDPAQLLDFPCVYEFKAFGPADSDETFLTAVQTAVSTVVPVPRDALRSRASRAGRHQCVTVLVRLRDAAQLQAIYAALRQVDGLTYLL